MCNRKERQKLIIEGIQIFQTFDRCWMNYEISKDDPLTYHHLIPQRKKGLTTMDNMGLLTSRAHRKFHLIERREPNTAYKINELFQRLNDTKKPPTEIYYEELEYYLNEFENKKVRVYIK